eukprot:3991965-Pleurochrysis_carterae.AAC.1
MAAHSAGQPLRRANGSGVLVALAAHQPCPCPSCSKVPRRKHPTDLSMGDNKQPEGLRAPGHG